MAVITPAQQTSIANLYTALFNRAPDANGFEFWSQALLNGASLSTITSSFMTSPESTAIYTSSQTSGQFVATFYQTVFGRAPDEGGLAFWTGVLNAAGGVGSSAAKSLLVSNIVEIVSTPMTTRPGNLTDAQYAETVKDRDTFTKKAVAGIDFAVNQKSNDLDAAKKVLADVITPTTPTTPTPTTPTTPTGPTTPTTPTTPSNPTDPANPLTTGQDTRTGGAGNDTFDARQVGGADTLTAGDVLDGGAGIDTLNVTLRATGGVAATLRNIEIVNLTAAGNNVSLDLGALGGLTEANIVGSGSVFSGIQLQNVGAASLSISNPFLNVVDSASFTGSTAASLTFKLTNVGNFSSTPNITLGSVATTLNFIASNSTAYLAKIAGSADLVNVNVTATGSNRLRVADSDVAKVKHITVAGTGAVDFSGQVFSALETFTATSGNIWLNLTGMSAQSITTGNGADTIYAEGTNLSTLSTGAGNDFISLRGALQDSTEIDGGDGEDTLLLNLTAAASLKPNLRNIEILNLSSTVAGVNVDLMGTGVRQVNLLGGNFNTISNVGDAALSIANQYSNLGSTIGFSGSTADVLSLKMEQLGSPFSKYNVNLAAAGSGPAATSYALTVNNAYIQLLGEAENLTRVTVNASGTNALNLSAADARKITNLVVTGTGSVDFSGQDMLKLTSATAGNGGIKLISSNTAVSALDVTTGDGVDTIVAVGASIKTLNVGAGNDVVTLNTSSLTAGAVVNLGAGDDTLILSTPLSAGATINAGAGRDILQISDLSPNYAAINSTVDFEVLAVGASGATVDVAQVTSASMTTFAVANTGTTTFINAKAGSAFVIDTSVNVTGVNIGTSNGVNAVSITLNYGASASTTNAIGMLAFSASSVSLTSSGNAPALGYPAIANIVTGLSLDAGAILNIDGTADLKLSLAAGTGGAINATSFMGKLTLTASDTAVVATGGRGADVITGSSANDTIIGGRASGNLADVLTGGAGNDNFKFLNLAETRNDDLLNNFRTDALLMDRITDFNGNGAGLGDSITFGVGANAFGTGLTFTTGTTAVVQAVAVSNVNDIRSLNDKVWAEVSATAVASTNAVAQVYDVTVTGGSLAGRYLILDNGDRAMNVADTMISLTGITGALDASDILFAA